MRDSENS
jgi:hypothetical protein